MPKSRRDKRGKKQFICWLFMRIELRIQQTQLSLIHKDALDFEYLKSYISKTMRCFSIL